MAAAAPILGGLQAAKTAERTAQGLVAGFMDAMRQPIYSDIRVDVTTHETEKGYVCTSTHTKGWTVPLGLVIGAGALVALWEVGQSVAKALSGWNGGIDLATQNPILTAAEIENFPVVIAYDAATSVVGVLQSSFLGQALTAGWDWLDGHGPSHKEPPPTTVKTVQMPATGMAALGDLMRTTLGGLSGAAGNIVPKMLAQLPT